MLLEDSIYESIHSYPSLFYYRDHPEMSDFEISRLAVLDHLFLVNGSGYCWVDGYLCIIDRAWGIDFKYPLGYTATKPKYGVLSYRNRDWPPSRKEGYKFACEYSYVSERPRKWPFAIYPIYEKGVMFPEFVRPDWLGGAIDIINFATEFFMDETSLDGNNEPIDVDTRYKSIIWLESQLKIAEGLKETNVRTD